MWLVLFKDTDLSDIQSAKWFFSEREAYAFRPYGDKPDQVIFVKEGRV